MKPYAPKMIDNFVDRHSELARLSQIAASGVAAIVVVYGRRRVGKTALLERALQGKNLFKFEGIEGESDEYQRRSVLEQASRYFEQPLLRELPGRNWREVFRALEPVVSTEPCVLYFAEVQWLAGYQPTFISELKFFWDNSLSRNNNLIVVLCGSSPSFMLANVLRSKALYNRALEDLPIFELPVEQAAELLPTSASPRDVFDAYLSVGGIPLYLEQLCRKSSTFLSLCAASFLPGGFFAGECERIFVSSLGEHPAYRTIVEHLARNRYGNRNEIAHAVGMSSGGRLSDLLEDLETCGFIESYQPLHLQGNSTLKRYAIKDPYLQFFYRFVNDQQKDIQRGKYNSEPTRALDVRAYTNWLAYAFERYCRRHHHLIAKRLGFSAVRYKSGAYFQKGSSDSDRGYQLDLCYLREDRTLTVCKIKYTETPIGKSVSHELDEKIDRMTLGGVRRIQKVLISAAGATGELKAGPYFDDVLDLTDFFQDNRSTA